MAGPTGGQVTTGSGQITQSGETTTIRQNSQMLALNWSSFNVAANETVDFVQPGKNAIAVNRITSSSGSEILGHLDANGQVWLINPNGILFGRGAEVNVGGLVASTLAPTGGDGSGSASFSGSGMGTVVNQGTITAAKGGYVALLGNSVSNQGVVSAQLGTVALGAGSTETLTFAGNKLLQLEVDKSTLNALAENKGLISAPGGAVYMTAGAANSLLASTVNTSGVIRANSFEDHDGTIVLSAGLPAGEVTVGGLIDVSSSRDMGGEVTATAGSVTVAPNTTVNASGAAGGGSIRIGGGWEGGEGVAQATTVAVADTATLDASATKEGNGGEIVVRSDVTNMNSTAEVAGTLLAAGGPRGGKGGRVETSGHWLDVNGVTVDTAAKSGGAGTWLLDPYNVTIGSSGTNVSGSGGTYTPSGDSTITASSIATALDNGNNVTISTYNAGGGSLGDITVSSAINKASGNTNVTLTLQAANTIAVNAPISNTGGTGKLNVNLYADNDGTTTNGTHDGVGVVILNNSITTGGGSINFGTGSTATVNGVANTPVGGDVYVGGSSAVNLTTAGGAVAINGALIIANPSGFNIDTTAGASTAGNVLFGSTIDSGDTYALITSFGTGGNVTWTQALADAKSGVGSATGDTYLATITSRLENAVASYDVGYQQSWLGAARVFGLNTDAEWRWVAGPEGLTNNGNGLPFFTQTGCDTNNCSPNNTGFNGGTAIGGAYTNWNPGTPEPNNYGGTSLNQAGSGEWTLQFVGTQGQWNDLNPTGHQLPFTQETNLAPSPLTVNAGTTGTVTFSGAIGSNKPLASLTVTGQILGLPSNPKITTTGPVIFNGQVQINNVDYNVVVVSAPDVTTTYGSVLPTFTPTFSGFIDGDTSASLTTQPTLTTTGSTSYVSTAPINASGAADATNPTRYYFVYDPGLLTVNPAPLTVVGTTVATRAYNGLTNATLSGGTLSGVLNSDVNNVTLTQSGTFTSKNAGSAVPVTVTDTISGSAANDYTLTEPTNVTGTISPLALTVTGSSVTPKTYDGTQTATLTGGSLSGVLNADAGLVSLTSQSGTFATKNAGSNIAVTATDTITATGSAVGDYTLTQPTGLTGTINPLALTVTGTSVTPKTYDGTQAATLTGGSLSGVLNADAGLVSLTSQSGTFATKNAGSNIAVTATDTITATGSAVGDYTLTQPTGLTGTINPLALTVTGSSVTPKTYDGTQAATLTGGTLSGVLNADAGLVSLTSQSGTYATKNAGSNIAVTATDTITATGSAVGDYTLTQPTGLTGTINPLALTVTGSSVTPKTYDGTQAATLSGGSLSGVLNADAGLVSLTSQSGTYATKNAGSNIAVTATDTITATGSAVGDYTLTQPTGLTGTINPLALTVTGTSVTPKTYDGTQTATLSGGSLSGVLNADAGLVSLTTQSGTFATKNAGSNIAVTATDTITATGSAVGDYTLTQPTGLTGTISPLALTVTGTSVTPKTYDGTQTATLAGGSLSGVLNADAGLVSLTSQSGTFATKNAGSNIAVTATDTITATGSAVGDYTLTQPTGLTGTINPLALTVTGTSVTPKTYDGTQTATLTGGSLSGVLNADSSLVSLAQSGTFATKNAGSNIAVTATDTLIGSAAGDYTFTQPTGLTGTIAPKPITVDGATGVNKTYDGTTALASSVTGYVNPTGFISGDQVAVTGGPVYNSAGAGSRSLMQGSVAFAGTDAGNYALSWVNGSGTISPASLTVTANSDARFIGLTDTAGYDGVSYQGFVDGQNSSVLGGSLSISRSNAGVGAAGTYSGVLMPAGLTATNYTINFVPGTYTIVPADELLVRTSNISTTYGSAPTYAITSVQYLNGNNVLLTLSQAAANGSTYTYSDGVGGTATFTLGASGAVTSGSGNLATGNYAIGDSGFASTGSNFRGNPVVVGELTVSPLGISASAATPPSKTYDGTASMSGTSIALSGVLSGDAVAGSGIGTFASKNAGTGLSYSLNGLSLTGADAQDYFLTNGVSAVGSNGSIAPLALTVLGSAVTPKTYDGTTTATLTGGALNGVLSADQGYVSLAAQGGTFASKNAGTGIAVTAQDTLTVTGAAVGDYTLTQPTGLTGAITPLALTVSGSSVTPKTYDGTTAATLTGGVLNGVLSSDRPYVSLATQSGSFASKNAGTGIAVTADDTLSATGPAAGDYTLVEPTGLTGTTAPRTVTLSGNETAQSKTYDGTTAATLSGGGLHGVVAGDSSGLSLVGTFASPNAGQHIAVAVALTGADASDYVLGGAPALAANIDPAPLVATANPVVTSLGGGQPALSGAFSGFVDGQTLAELEAAGYRANWTSAVSSTSAAGHYSITGSFNDGNYSVVQAAGNATAFDATLSAASISNTSGSVISTLAGLQAVDGGAGGLGSIGGIGSAAGSGAGFAVGTGGGSAGAQGAGSTTASLSGANGSSAGSNGGVDVAGGSDASGSSSGTSASAGNGAGLTLGANTASAANDGTVTLSDIASSGGVTASGGGMAGGGASPGGNASTGTKTTSLTDFGGRRLIVISGGVNSSIAR